MEKCVVTKRRFCFKTLIIVCMLLNAVRPQTLDRTLTLCEVEVLLQQLSTPNGEFQMHVRPQTLDRTLTLCEVEVLLQQLSTPNGEFQMHATALRNQLRNLLEKYQNDLYQQLNTNDINDYIEQNKRDSSSSARNSFYHNEKRYIGALAKSGMLRSQYDDVKRGIATLAKNGQLPSREPDVDDSGVQTWEGKRNLAAMARSGFLNGKRNVATLARDFQLPSSGKRDLPPMLRFIYAPILKKHAGHSTGANLLPLYSEKRNIGAMARDWSLPNLQKLSDIISGEEKRNIGSLKNSREHGKRQKRDVLLEDFDEHSSEKIDPIQQSTLDYDELKDVINHIDPFYDGNIHEEKRFLEGSKDMQSHLPPNKRNIGSLARLGLLRSDYSRFGSRKLSSYRQQEQKRHIGALARSGWLPAFRPSRSGRFSRSGRARSRIVGYYPQPERLRQPIAGVCRRCEEIQLQHNAKWGAQGMQSNFGTPPRLTALHWRSLRPTGNFY